MTLLYVKRLTHHRVDSDCWKNSDDSSVYLPKKLPLLCFGSVSEVAISQLIGKEKQLAQILLLQLQH